MSTYLKHSKYVLTLTRNIMRKYFPLITNLLYAKYINIILFFVRDNLFRLTDRHENQTFTPDVCI